MWKLQVKKQHEKQYIQLHDLIFVLGYKTIT